MGERIDAGQPGTERDIAALTELGDLASASGDDPGALTKYRDALDLARAGGDDAAQAVVGVNLGRVRLALGKTDEAIADLQEALERSVACDDRVTQAAAMTQLARALVVQGNGVDPDGVAEELLLASIALCDELDDPHGTISCLGHLAALQIASDRLDEAVLHLRRAVEICAETGTPNAPVAVLEELSEQYELRGETSRALEIARWVISLQEQRLGGNGARRGSRPGARHELDEARMEAEVVRLRNLELVEKSEALEQTNATLQLLHGIGSELTSTLDLEEIGRRLHDRINELMSADVFGIAVYREEEQLLDFTLVIEDDQRITPFTVPVSSEDSFGSWVVRHREEICLNDADRLHKQYVLHRKPFTARNCRSIVFLPLELERRIVGVLTVQSHRRNMYNSEKMAILRLLSPYIAVALDNARKLATIRALNDELEAEKEELEDAYARIEYMANHDILTQLPNRRLLAELVHEYIALARRQSRVFGLLYVDLDDFKPINDSLGHEAGDQVLITIATRLRGALRESDTVARIGGDEFVVIVREAGGVDDVVAVAEKVNAAVRCPVTIGGSERELAASIGVSVFPRDGDTYDALLMAADDAMYRRKQSGKSGIYVSGAPIERTSRSDQTMESPSKTNRPST